MGEEHRYCMCCGEAVPVTVVERDGRAELNCLQCGFTLDVAEAQPEPPRPVPCVIAVDDAASQLAVVRSLLERSGLAEQVVALTGGAQFVSALAQRFAEGLPVAMVILDVEMPAMDGFTAARFLRTLETRLRRPPCPLVFFTARAADENLRRQMALFRPAWYCAKGVDGDQAAFERRATKLIAHVARLLAAAPP
jgi:CheY-like chemotaxis protein